MLPALAALLLASPAHPAPARVTLASAVPGRVAFDVEVPPLRLIALPGADGMVRPELEDYQPAGVPDAPGLPGRVLTVAVPPDGNVTVSGSTAEPEVHDGVLLAPVPRLSKTARGSAERYLRQPAAYAAARTDAGPRAELIGVTWLRNQRIARIAVRPADYEPASRRLTLWRRIHVEVAVAPAPSTSPAERNDPFEAIYRDVLVNYDQGRSWRRPVGRIVPARAARAGLAAAAQTVPDTSVFVGRTWVKIRVSKPGLYKLDFQKVQKFPPFQNSVTSWSDVRLFTWPGYPVLPEGSYCDTCDYREVAFGLQDDGGDGQFHSANDFLYFYAMGTSNWASRFDPSWPDSAYINDPYDGENAYFLTASTVTAPIPGPAKRIVQRNADADTTLPALVLRSVPERLHLENENPPFYPNSPPLEGGTANGLGTVDGLVWQKWFWTTVAPADIGGRAVSFDLPGLDSSQAVHVHLRLWGLNDPLDSPVAVINYIDPVLDGLALPEGVWPLTSSLTYDTTLAASLLRETGNTLALTAPPRFNNSASVVGLGFLEARYLRKLRPDSAGRIEFEVPATGQRTLIRIDGYPGPTPPMMFDISDVNAPVQLLSFGWRATSDTTHELAFAVDGTTSRRFTTLPDGGFEVFSQPTVNAASRSSMVNLRRLGADYLVIYFDGTTDEFGAAADTLAAWRGQHLPLSGVSPPYVASKVGISAIYDQFSGGRTDPAAIRNFLRAVFYAGDTVGTGATGGRRLSHVTFLGAASFDFKNLYGLAAPGHPGSLLPTYENGYDGSLHRQFTTDDWLANVDDASTPIPDIFTGRLPVGDATQAMDLVRNKVLFYERSSPLGEWRNEVLLIADDNKQCGNVDPVDWGHVAHTAAIDTTAVPSHMDRVYDYLHKDPHPPEDCDKPVARKLAFDTINQGVLMMNFVGHGSEFELADEGVMRNPDIPSLTNAPRFPLVCTWSCDVGRFDDPRNPGLGELLLLQPGGGAMGVVSSTELAFSTYNLNLNRLVYQKLFARDTLSGQYEVTVAQALVTGKVLGARANGPSGLRNDVKYQLLGDAAAKLALPHLWVELTLRDSSDQVITELPRGSRVRFTGRVVTSPGGAAVPLRGRAALRIEDTAGHELTPDFGLYGYYVNGAPIYLGSVTFEGGQLAGAFVVPTEALLGTRGRVRAYIEGEGEPGRAVEDDGVGNLQVSVTPGTGVPPDSSGPAISLSFPGGATDVRPDAVLTIRLADPSGILTTDHVPLNGILVTVDGNSTARTDVTSTFRYDDNSYQSGQASFTLPRLATGTHHIQVSAADNLARGFAGLAHRSSAGIDFEVVETPALRVARAYLFPDPTCSRCADRGGQFLVDVPGDSVNVLLRMYTVSGRLIRTLVAPGGIGRVQIPWDGLDEEHQPLANGVYLFRVNVNGRDADGKSSARLHAVGDGRFVIVNH